MIQLRPNQGDLERLKEPFGKLILGDPPKTMPELNSIISRLHPRKVVAVGDVVSRETYAAGIRVDLRIIDHISMRKPTATFNLRPKTTYHVKNPAGVITLESWEAMKREFSTPRNLCCIQAYLQTCIYFRIFLLTMKYKSRGRHWTTIIAGVE